MERTPYKINSGVAQGSLVSPLLYDWYVNDLISILSKKLGTENIFAYADDVALLCLGYSDIRSALSVIEEWCETNGAMLNKKKCGILPIRKKDKASPLKELEGIPFVREYKYLGVPLDPALTLKHLHTLLKTKIKTFSQRVRLVLRHVVGTDTKFKLWQTYARCHFDYFSPAIAICGKIHKFEPLYSQSLKKALDLPLHLPTEPLIKAVNTPSLTQIAAYHITCNKEIIQQRFGRCPSSLTQLTESLSHAAEDYLSIKKKPAIESTSRNLYKVDLRAISLSDISMELLGLATGTYLTLRHTDTSQGLVGSVKNCTNCKLPGTQTHFLNDCPLNTGARTILRDSIPNGVQIPLLAEGDFATFFMNFRKLEVYSFGIIVTPDLLLPLLEATILSATSFVKTTLSDSSPTQQQQANIEKTEEQ